MKFNIIGLLLCLSLGIVLFPSCQKENLDSITITEEENNPEVVVCDLSVTINELPNGVLEATVSDGTAPYTYTWSTGDTTPTTTPNATGTYTVVVTDADGCTAEATYEASSNPCLSFFVSISEDPLSDVLTATLSGGAGAPYVYAWSSGETTASITVTVDGIYSVTVTDVDGCTAVDSYTVTGSDPCLLFSGTIVEDAATGVLNVSLVNGTAPYAYLWSTGENTSTISPNSTGVYSVTVTDANGCVVTDTIDLSGTDPCASFSVSVQASPATGILNANATGGVAPYTYSWSTGDVGSTLMVNSPGSYTVVATDAQGCTVATTVQI